MEAFDAIRNGVMANRSQYFFDLTIPFYGFNRPGAKESEGLRRSFWRQGMQAGIKAAYDCVKQFSETDFTEDLKAIDVPLLVVHGDDDQIVPIAASALRTVELAPNARLLVYPGGSHGLAQINADRFNADLLAFARA